MKSDGTLDRYKARLVAQGFKHEYGIDYEETFAPVTKINVVRTLLSIAAVHHWPLWKMDVKNAFLHGDVQETMYMRLPPGFNFPPKMVCHLKKSLYGLKQAILKAQFHQSYNDHSLFFRRISKDCTILLLYVDDIIISRNDALESVISNSIS